MGSLVWLTMLTVGLLLAKELDASDACPQGFRSNPSIFNLCVWDSPEDPNYYKCHSLDRDACIDDFCVRNASSDTAKMHYVDGSNQRISRNECCELGSLQSVTACPDQCINKVCPGYTGATCETNRCGDICRAEWFIKRTVFRPLVGNIEVTTEITTAC